MSVVITGNRKSINEYAIAENHPDDAAAIARNAAEWQQFEETGQPPEWFRKYAEEMWHDDDKNFGVVMATITGDTKRSEGVPDIYDISNDGSVTIFAGDQDLRRVVIQPIGEIALELASPDAAESFAASFNATHADSSRWAEIIDYFEVHRRAKAAGF